MTPKDLPPPKFDEIPLTPDQRRAVIEHLRKVRIKRQQVKK